MRSSHLNDFYNRKVEAESESSVSGWSVFGLLSGLR